ncbi:hypothetical protein LEMLEM_LOCUS13219 [Lemmus lemmus]
MSRRVWFCFTITPHIQMCVQQTTGQQTGDDP